MNEDNQQPRSIKEALILEIMADTDKLLSRSEFVSANLKKSTDELENTIKILNAAGERYQQTVVDFSNAAKVDLQNYFDKKSAEILSQTIEEQKALIQEIVRNTFKNEAVNQQPKNKLNTSKKVELGLIEILIIGLTPSLVLLLLYYFVKGFH